MAYLPLARKYRPQAFEELIGQPHVTATLTHALESRRLGQAYLFAGARGVGKTSAARILAKCLNCTDGPRPTPCQTCPNCLQITQGNSLDVMEIDGASNRGIDEIRSLRDTVPFAPTTGAFRVYIIDEVHMLTTEAFNALLKTLEEPPAHVKFIFATTAPQKVPATILSRCQRFDFRRIEVPALIQALRRLAEAEGIRLDEGALFAIAHAADGSLRDAEVILEQLASFVEGPIRESHVTELLGSVESAAMASLMEAILTRQPAEALRILLRETEQGKGAAEILAGLLRHTRNLLMVHSTREAPKRAELLARLVDEPPERLAALEQQADRTTAGDVLLFLQALTGAHELARRSTLGSVVLELVVVKLATREAWQSLEAIASQLAQAAVAAAVPAPGASGVAGREARGIPPRGADRPGGPQAAETIPAPGAQAEEQAPEAVRRIWPVFLERLGAQKMSLAAYLMHAKPLRLDGATLTVGLAGFALHQEVVSHAEHRRVIDQLLSELVGRPVTVQYATLPAAAAAQETMAPPVTAPALVQDIVNLFNASVIGPARPHERE